MKKKIIIVIISVIIFFFCLTYIIINNNVKMFLLGTKDEITHVFSPYTDDGVNHGAKAINDISKLIYEYNNL